RQPSARASGLLTKRGRIAARGARATPQEDIMRSLIVGAVITLCMSAPAWAQAERGYVTGAGGFAVTPDTTSGDGFGEAAWRIAPHLMVFGDLGRFHNLQPSEIQPTVDSTTAFLSADQGLNVTGTGRVPAWYSVGGLRYEAPVTGRVTPYVLGGIGFARLTPTAQFTYASGPLPDGSTPAAGAHTTTPPTTP